MLPYILCVIHLSYSAFQLNINDGQIKSPLIWKSMSILVVFKTHCYLIIRQIPGWCCTTSGALQTSTWAAAGGTTQRSSGYQRWVMLSMLSYFILFCLLCSHCYHSVSLLLIPFMSIHLVCPPGLSAWISRWQLSIDSHSDAWTIYLIMVWTTTSWIHSCY